MKLQITVSGVSLIFQKKIQMLLAANILAMYSLRIVHQVTYRKKSKKKNDLKVRKKINP